jgi:ApaG protein
MSIIKTAITQGVKVTAYPKYIPDESKPLEGRFFHAYRITIQNNSANTIQLLKRHWNIYDTIGGMRSIQGEGVVGETPVLKKGDTYSYTSEIILINFTEALLLNTFVVSHEGH